MNGSRLVRSLVRELWLQRLPHGLVSWRYLTPGADERVRLHRHLWWASRRRPWPLLPWLMVQGWVWLRWVLFWGWWYSAKALWRRGRAVKAAEGVVLWRQGLILVRLCLGHCIAPVEVYRYRLYLQPARVWDYVFVQEVAAYHRWRSNPFGKETATARELLADKLRLGDALAEYDVPLAPVLACVPQGSAESLSPWLREGARLFCKTRSGNRGLGAFTVWRTGGVVAGRCLDGRVLGDERAVAQAWQALRRRDDALIQPCLCNHPLLAPLAEGDDAITVRYITVRTERGYGCLCATLEIPAGRDERCAGPLYVTLPIDAVSGQIGTAPALVDPDETSRHAAIVGRLPAAGVPQWTELATASLRAHRVVPELWAVAWDWVVTPDGPRLLEGNSGWDVAPAQRLLGALLREEPVHGGDIEERAQGPARGRLSDAAAMCESRGQTPDRR